MRGKSAIKGRSGSSTPPARDVALLDTDQFLPNEELDELWEWFFTASAEGMDPELVFVKLINSVGTNHSLRETINNHPRRY